MYEYMMSDAMADLAETELNAVHDQWSRGVHEAAARGRDRMAMYANAMASMCDWERMRRTSSDGATIPPEIVSDLIRATSALSNPELDVMARNTVRDYAASDERGRDRIAAVGHALCAIFDAEQCRRKRVLEESDADFDDAGMIVADEAEAIEKARQELRGEAGNGGENNV